MIEPCYLFLAGYSNTYIIFSKEKALIYYYTYKLRCSYIYIIFNRCT